VEATCEVAIAGRTRLAPGKSTWNGRQDRLARRVSSGGGPPTVVTSVEQLREAFEKNVALGERALSSLTEERANGDWRLVFQGKEILRKKRIAALRTNVLNHLYHHRGQMSVYLRLLDVPVPVVYGPTADENPFL
jgi:hypothetical protein